MGDLLLVDIRKIAQTFQFLQIFINGIKLLYFLPLDTKGRINLEGKFLNLVHAWLQHFELLIYLTNIILHLSYCIDTADKLGIVLKNQWLNLVIMHFNLFINLVVFSDQLFYSVLLDHVENIAFWVEVWWVNVHLMILNYKLQVINDLIL